TIYNVIFHLKLEQEDLIFFAIIVYKFYVLVVIPCYIDMSFVSVCI
ncbi:unnamed protein product, partial [Brassica rapa subsp. trilocularis]